MNLALLNAAFLVADVVKVFNPQSPQARAIFDLTIVVIVVMVVIFAVVVGIVMYALLGFPRWREGERDPEQVEGNNTIEIVWTAIPLAIVTMLFVLSARTMEARPCGHRPSMVVGSALHEFGRCYRE